jgi:hypothetical protein
MTGEYTFVTPERQNELPRRIQEKIAGAAKNFGETNARSQEPTLTLAKTLSAMTLVQ